MVVDKKTKTWVDEQIRLNKQERQNYGTKYIEGTDQTYPMQYTRTQSPNLKRGGSEPNLPRKQNMVPQPTQALTEFVKHVADPLVDKGWNLHLKFGKGEPQKEEFAQGTTPPETSTKAVDKEKVHVFSREKQTPLEMGIGGGGRGKRGGGGGKRIPEDKIEFGDHLKEKDDEDDSSTETSFELEVTPKQLASVNPNRPILRLQLSPWPQLLLVEVDHHPQEALLRHGHQKGPGHGRPVQPSESGERLPQPLGGTGGGGLPQPPEGSGRPPRHPGGGGAPTPGGKGTGNGNGGGGGKPPPRRDGNGGGDGDGDRDGGGDSPPPSDPEQPQHH